MSDHEHRCPSGMGNHLTCREIAEFLLGYLERELDEQVLAEFDTHLHRCPPCEVYLETYRETVELVRRCGKRECDEADKAKWQKPPEDLVQAILKAKQSGCYGLTSRVPQVTFRVPRLWTRARPW
jgi:hypothetical protein